MHPLHFAHFRRLLRLCHMVPEGPKLKQPKCPAGNVYGVLPNNVARNVSIILMIIHQVVAYALYMTPGIALLHLLSFHKASLTLVTIFLSVQLCAHKQQHLKESGL